MSMIKCHECGKDVSTEAKVCPSCGAKPKKPTSIVAWVVASVFSIFVFKAVFDASESTPTPRRPPSPELIAAEQQREREFQTVLAGARLLKESMKKPESFELLSATLIDGKAMCFEYKARNSFNDQRREFYVVTDNVSSNKPGDWNKHCANKSGTDYTYARSAL